MLSVNERPNKPLHGLTLNLIIFSLVERYGWVVIAEHVPVNCFINDTSISSSLKFLRKTPWARVKVEQLYLKTQQHIE